MQVKGRKLKTLDKGFLRNKTTKTKKITKKQRLFNYIKDERKELSAEVIGKYLDSLEKNATKESSINTIDVLKTRLRERMLNTFLIVKPKQSSSYYGYYLILKNFVIVICLRSFGLTSLSIKISEKALKKAHKETYSDLVILFGRFLRKIYSQQNNRKAVKRINAILNKSIQAHNNILFLEEIHQNFLFKISDVANDRQNLISYSNQINQQLAGYSNLNFEAEILRSQIEMLSFLVQGDYQNCIRLGEITIDKIKSKKQVSIQKRRSILV